MSDPASLTVLVADDNPAARAQIVAILNDIGHEAVPVDNGTEAISALSALSFDLAILDFQMPGAGGDEVARQAGGTMRLIGLSSSGADRSEWGDAPVHGWLAKPVDARALALMIRSVMDDEAAGDGESEEPVDLAHLATYTAGERGLEGELAALFSASCERYFDEMAGATDDRSWREAAHGLKGAARGIGANELGRLAAFAETLVGGHASNRRRAETLQQMRTAAERVRQFFAEHLGDG
ncbi:response regulator [Minwuia sp.]|uniref:Hpt domain-containing response regulator n=1 Tax=Minwuia sp. TaxID=2493630 RepID=UPI003A90D5C7